MKYCNKTRSVLDRLSSNREPLEASLDSRLETLHIQQRRTGAKNSTSQAFHSRRSQHKTRFYWHATQLGHIMCGKCLANNFGETPWARPVGTLSWWHSHHVWRAEALGFSLVRLHLYNSLRQPTSWRKYEFTNSEWCRRRFLY